MSQPMSKRHKTMALLRYNSHPIQFNHLKSIINFRTFSSPPKENTHLSAVTPHFPPLSLAQATTNLLYVSMALPILDISHKWSPIYEVLYDWLLSLTRNVFKVHSCCSKYQHFIPFLLLNIALYGYIILFICWLNLDCSHFLAIINQTAMNILVQVLVLTHDLIFLGYILRSRVSE